MFDDSVPWEFLSEPSRKEAVRIMEFQKAVVKYYMRRQKWYYRLWKLVEYRIRRYFYGHKTI